MTNDVSPFIEAVESMGGGVRAEPCTGGKLSEGCNNKTVLVLPYAPDKDKQGFAPVCFYCDLAPLIPRIAAEVEA